MERKIAEMLRIFFYIGASAGETKFKVYGTNRSACKVVARLGLFDGVIQWEINTITAADNARLEKYTNRRMFIIGDSPSYIGIV